jgi:hypothetical protein
MMNIRRYLDILEIESVSSPEELKQAYRDLVQIWHPDRFHGNSKLEKKAGEKLREITGAYNHLLAYFDPDQRKCLRTSIQGIQDESSRLGEINKIGIQNRGRPYYSSSDVNETRGRKPSKLNVLKAYPAPKTSSAPKYILFLFLIIILGISSLVAYRIYNIHDSISTSIEPASEILEKLIIEEMGKESVSKVKPSVQNIINDIGKEILPTESKSHYEIYLDSGNVIITESWWKEDEMIMYKKCGGSMGIESTRVKKIIKR